MFLYIGSNNSPFPPESPFITNHFWEVENKKQMTTFYDLVNRPGSFDYYFWDNLYSTIL